MRINQLIKKRIYSCLRRQQRYQAADSDALTVIADELVSGAVVGIRYTHLAAVAQARVREVWACALGLTAGARMTDVRAAAIVVVARVGA